VIHSNEGKFGNKGCRHDFPSTSLHFEGRGYLLFTGISSPSFPCTSFLLNSTSMEANGG